MFTYTKEYLFIYYGNLFIMNLDICVPWYCFEHENLCIRNVCTAIFRSFGKKLRPAENNHCRLNFEMTELYRLIFSVTEAPRAVLAMESPPA